LHFADRMTHWMRTSALAALGMALVLGAGACKTKADRERDARKMENEADRELGAALAQLDAERNEYSARVRVLLDDLDRRVEGLRAAAASQAGEAREQADRALADVATRRATLENDLHGVGTVTAASWVDLKDKIARDLDALQTAVSAASEHP